eukprot:ctg_314.g115
MPQIRPHPTPHRRQTPASARGGAAGRRTAHPALAAPPRASCAARRPPTPPRPPPGRGAGSIPGSPHRTAVAPRCRSHRTDAAAPAAAVRVPASDSAHPATVWRNSLNTTPRAETRSATSRVARTFLAQRPAHSGNSRTGAKTRSMAPAAAAPPEHRRHCAPAPRRSLLRCAPAPPPPAMTRFSRLAGSGAVAAGALHGPPRGGAVRVPDGAGDARSATTGVGGAGAHVVVHVSDGAAGAEVGLLQVGWGGNNGSTVTAAVVANRERLSWAARGGPQAANYYGSLTQAATVHVGSDAAGRDVYVPLSSLLPMVHPNDLVLGGWDVSSLNLADALERAQVLEPDLRRQLRPLLQDMRPWPGAFDRSFIASNQWPRADNVLAGGKGEQLRALRGHIQQFKREHALERAVVVWTGNSERYSSLPPEAHQRAPALLAAIDADHAEVSPSTLYAVAAVLEHCPFVNGSPQNTLLPSVVELARQHHVPVLGDDFKSARPQSASDAPSRRPFAPVSVHTASFLASTLCAPGHGRNAHDAPAANRARNARSSSTRPGGGRQSLSQRVHYRGGGCRRCFDKVDQQGNCGAAGGAAVSVQRCSVAVARDGDLQPPRQQRYVPVDGPRDVAAQVVLQVARYRRPGGVERPAVRPARAARPRGGGAVRAVSGRFQARRERVHQRGVHGRALHLGDAQRVSGLDAVCAAHYRHRHPMRAVHARVLPADRCTGRLRAAAPGAERAGFLHEIATGAARRAGGECVATTARVPGEYAASTGRTAARVAFTPGEQVSRRGASIERWGERSGWRRPSSRC